MKNEIIRRSLYRILLPDFFDCPEPLTTVLQTAWERKYSDLYEEFDDYNVEEAFEEVMQCVGNPLVNSIEHKRYVYIAWSMAIAAKPTLDHYYPEDSRVLAVFKDVSGWLKDSKQALSYSSQSLFPDIDKRSPYQAADEAYSIMFELLRSLNPKTAGEATLNILYDAITGDAISGFAAAKRDIFNWWIVEVVPSGYYLRLPAKTYSGKWIFPPLSQ